MSHDRHIVIGAGATGSATARLLADTGRTVTLVTRSGSGPEHPGIQLVAADASDPTTLIRLAAGAAVIYNCANPSYERWTTDWPPLAASILAAAEANDAVLATLSNLYAYPRSDRPMLAMDPLDPPSVKGAVRATMWADALAAHQAGRVRVVEVRASDFIGPGLGGNGHMGDRVVPRVLAGKSVSLLGSADVDHSWTAIADVASTLVALAADERAWGRPWLVPTVAPLSQRALVHRMCELAGVDPVTVRTMPSAMLSLAGLFSPVIRELKEIVYQFEGPFVIDSSETTETFGLEPTPLDETLTATLASYAHSTPSVAIG